MNTRLLSFSAWVRVLNRCGWLVAIWAFQFVQMVQAQEIPVYSSIQPNTETCYLGTKDRPGQLGRYCVDSTWCKQVPNAGVVCLSDTPASLVPAGAQKVDVAGCWQWRSEYTCLQAENQCAAMEADSSCSRTSKSFCLADENGVPMVDGPSGLCINTVKSFLCPVDPIDCDKLAAAGITSEQCAEYAATRPSTTTITTSCDVTGLQGDLVWQTPSAGTGAADFGQAIVFQTIAQQAALTGDNTTGELTSFFPGNKQTCRTGRAGLLSCCMTERGFTNLQATRSMGQKVLGALGGGKLYSEQTGSPLDNVMLYWALGQALYTGLVAAWTTAAAGSTAAAAAGAGTTAAGASLYSSVLGTVAVVAIVVIVIIVLYMYASECHESEFELAPLRGEGLCVEAGSRDAVDIDAAYHSYDTVETYYVTECVAGQPWNCQEVAKTRITRDPGAPTMEALRDIYQCNSPYGCHVANNERCIQKNALGGCWIREQSFC
ncbi:hypothetical protein ACQV5M_18825, partial [Leptospira sp. SA-E8]|uniref:hypothetical protein n=1 Tax=Leptospira sp. SA-E8 TaxID=3422259 RepID=UPI003EB9B760